MNYQPTQLLFIDATVSDIEILLEGTLPGIEAHILSGEQDGVAQITQIIQHRPEVNTVHIVSHGSPGCLYLGNNQLSLDTLKDYASQLKGCSRENLNLLLYGCNVAAGDAGEEFLDKLHSLTNAKIAASATKTGNAALGADWDLEMTLGDIIPQLAFSDQAIANYAGILASTVSFDVSSLFNADVIVNRTGGVTDNVQTSIDLTNHVLLTQSAAVSLDTTSGNGLPDDGFFAANSVHPDIQLSYRNADNGNNARLLKSPESFTFSVVNGKYAYVHLAFTSTEGSSNVNVIFNYSDGTTDTITETFPDWYNSLTPSNTLYYLIDGLDRTKINGSPLEDSNNAAVFGLRFSVNPAKTLQSIKVEKTSSTGYLVFFGATGEFNTAPALTGPPASLKDGTQDTPYTISAPDLLQGYTDLNGDTLSLSGVTASNGTIVNNGNGIYIFTPNANYNGTVNLSYNVIDTKAGTTAATRTFTLIPVNVAPLVNPTTFTIQENSANGTVLGAVTGSDVEGNSLSNWTIASGNTDVDHDGNSAFAINSTTGQITVNDSGDLDFKTQARFNLQVTVSDGSATSNSGNVTINLLNVLEFTPGNDVGNGTSGNDIMDALDGNDRLYGFGGNDTIWCGTGADIAYGGDGDDSIDGGNGDDRLYGDSGRGKSSEAVTSRHVTAVTFTQT